MNFLASFMNLAGPDLIIILLIILVLVCAKKLPELARGMGQAVKEFQKAKDEFSDELHKAAKSEPETAESDVKPAQVTVPLSENQPASSEERPDPSQASTPIDKAGQVYQRAVLGGRGDLRPARGYSGKDSRAGSRLYTCDR